MDISPAVAEGIRLEAVEIKGQIIASGSAAYSSTRLETGEIREKGVDQVQVLFRHVPGMGIRNLGLTGVADNIVLRGFGGGGHGGDIAFSVDGIPLNEAMSHADGYADLNVIIPLELRSLTVHKGPVSSLFGNYNRAGTVMLETRKGGEYREADLSVASHGTVDVQTAMGMRVSDNQHLNLAAQVYSSDGFRDQSDSWRATLAGRWSIDFGEHTRLALSGRLHGAEADNPGYLSEANFRIDPYSVEPGIQNDGAEKDFTTLRADLHYTLNDGMKLLSFAYLTRQDFTRWFTRPVSGIMTQREETYDRKVYGAGMNLNGQHASASFPMNWVAGIETFRESTDYEYYDGLDHRERINPAVNDRTSRLNNVALFGEAELPLHALFKPSIGLRWDRFSGDCEPNGPETSTAPCERMPGVSHASPKLGLRSQVSDAVELRTSVAEGFALPSNFAKYSLGAADLDPNVFRQTEIGARVNVSSRLMVDVSAYRIISSNEIRTVAPGVYENFGSTRRSGYEVEALWLAHDTLDFTLAWGVVDSRITKNADAALIGNKVTGVPEQTVTLEANWRPTPAWLGTLTWQKVGEYRIDAANTMHYGGYDVVDLRAGYSGGVRHPYTVYAAIDNVADRVYATAASALGYAAGAPRTFRVGLRLDF